VSYVERDGRRNVRDPREAGLMMHPCGWPTRASAQALKRAIASLYVHRFTRHAPSPKEATSGFLAFPAPLPPGGRLKASHGTPCEPKSPAEGALLARLALVVGLGLFQPLP